MRAWGPVAVGVVLAVGLAWTGRPPEAGAEWRFAFVGLHLGAFAALVAWLRTVTPSVRTVVVGAVLFRLVALPMLPSLSDDGYRYLWDGRVTVEAGESPYAYRPSDAQLSALQPTKEYARMNSPDYHSVYPPVSQGAFAVAVALNPTTDWRVGWWIWKLLMVLAEGMAILLLLRASGPRATALYAWSPLAVIEIAGQGHTESLVLLGLGLALQAGRLHWPSASVGLALAGGVKLWPLVWLPQAWRREGWAGVAASVGIVSVLAVPLVAPGAMEHIAESLGLFFGVFDEYAAPYLVLKSLLHPIVGDAAGAAASRALAVTFLGTVAVLALTDDGTHRAWRRVLTVSVLAFALTTSTLHPWYWLPVLYLGSGSKYVVPLLWLTAWSSAAYAGYVSETMSLTATAIGWGGAGVLLGLRRWRLRSAPPAPPRSRSRRLATQPPGSAGTT